MVLNHVKVWERCRNRSSLNKRQPPGLPARACALGAIGVRSTGGVCIGACDSLQIRIVKAEQGQKKRKVRALQRILVRSLGGRALAVKRVTTNRGKQTPGVDKVVWDTPEKKMQAIEDLREQTGRPQPLRRVSIPKSNGGVRALGIPTMHDRARQALHLLGLEPLAETRADPNSYGFRPARSTADAIDQCFGMLARKTSAQWVLEGDIRACFDGISHDWLLANVPLDKAMLAKWLKAG